MLEKFEFIEMLHWYVPNLINFHRHFEFFLRFHTDFLKPLAVEENPRPLADIIIMMA